MARSKKSSKPSGYSFLKWTKSELRIILGRHSKVYNKRYSKIELWQKLGEVLRGRGFDNLEIVSTMKAIRAGQSLPQRKPILVPRMLCKEAHWLLRYERRHKSKPRGLGRVHTGHHRVATYGNATNEQNISQTPEPEIKETKSQYRGPECAECEVPLNAANTANRLIMPDCRHEPNVCVQCMVKPIVSRWNDIIQLKDIDWDKIWCPTCIECLEEDDMQIYAGVMNIDQYIIKRLEEGTDTVAEIAEKILRISQVHKQLLA